MAHAQRMDFAAFRRLKPQPCLPRKQVHADQRRRLHAATISLVADSGPGAGTVRSVTRRAGIFTATRLAGELGDWTITLPDAEVHSLSRALGHGRARHLRRSSVATPSMDWGAHVEVEDRRRVLRAVIRLVTLDGLPSLTALRLRAEVGLSRRRFDACFGSLEECVL
jgi:hypothetical protein